MGPVPLWAIDDVRRDLSALVDHATYQKPDLYRIFTRRLKEMFGSYQVLKGDETLRTVDVIYANPERAVAKIAESRTTILPLLSLQFEGIEVDDKRRRPLEVVVDQKFWNQDKQRAIRYMALAPVAANIQYAVNVWGKYIEEVNQLTEQILLSFRPNLPVDIRENEIYQAYIKNVTETSQLTAPNLQDRIIKRAIQFEVQSYIPSKVFRFTNTGEMETMNFETFLEETGEMLPLESFYATGGDAPGARNRGIMITFTTTTTA